MSGTFPTSPAANSVTIKSIEPTLVSITQNLKRQVRRRGGQRWQLDIEFPPCLLYTSPSPRDRG